MLKFVTTVLLLPTLAALAVLFSLQEGALAKDHKYTDYPLNLTVPIVVVWLVLGVIYLFYLQRNKPLSLERGKDMFLNDPEPEPTDLEHALL